MKNKISLLAMRSAVISDSSKLLSLYIIASIINWMMFVYLFVYGLSVLSHVAYVVTIISIISMTFIGKAALDLVHNRKRDLFSHPFFLLQTSLVQVAMLGLCYGVVTLAFRDMSHIVGLWLGADGFSETEDLILFSLFILLLYFLMRLQFASLYILEQRCSIAQAMHRSLLFTRRNIRLVERLFLWEVAIVNIWILSMNFIFSLHWNIDFAIMSIAIVVVLATPIKVRMFKELK